MFSTLREIFSESSTDGRLSLMRIMSFIALFVCIGLSIYSVSTGGAEKNYNLILSWLVSAFAPKALQKAFEKR